MPVILALERLRQGGYQVQGQPGHNKNLSQKTNQNQNQKFRFVKNEAHPYRHDSEALEWS
jgi:biotin operon repressor